MQKTLIDKYAKYFRGLLKYDILANSPAGKPDITHSGGNPYSSGLTITDGARSFQIFGKDVIDLELKLNLSPYGTAWKNLSVYLHNFYLGNQSYNNSIPSTLYITDVQWDYLNSLKANLSNIYTYPVSPNVYYTNKNVNSITFSDGFSSLYIDGSNESDLLSKLNLTTYAYQWGNIILALKNCSFGINPSDVTVTSEQLNVLRNLYLRNMPSVVNQYNENRYGMVNSSDFSSPDVWDEHPKLAGAKVIFSDGEENITIRGEEIYKLYKKIKASKFSKKFKKIKTSMINIRPYSSIPILVNREELEILSLLRKHSLEHIEKNYAKEKKDKKKKSD